MLRGGFALTLPIMTLYLGRISDWTIPNKICGSVSMLTRLWVMRYIVLMFMETLALLRSSIGASRSMKVCVQRRELATSAGET